MDVVTSKRVLVLGKSGWEGLPAASPLIPGLSWGCEPALRKCSHRSIFFLMDGPRGQSGSYPNTAVWPPGEITSPFPALVPPAVRAINVHLRASFTHQIHS